MSEASVYERFLDESGQPILRNCAVLYLDVLGVAAFSVAPEREQLLRNLLEALAIAREEAMVEADEPWQALTWFTDNVVIAFPIVPGHIDEEPALGSALRAASYLQLRLAISGFFARGGIAFGEIHMARNVAFGPALVEAVMLEQTARMPRVVLSSDAIGRQRKVMRSWASDVAPQRLEMAVDEDGEVFVDYLRFWIHEEQDRSVFERVLMRHRQSLEHELAAHAHAPDVRRKFEWLARYHNWVVETTMGKARRFIVAGADAGGFSHFA